MSNPRTLSQEALTSLLGKDGAREFCTDTDYAPLPHGLDLCTFSDSMLAVDHYINMKENEHDRC